MAEMTCRSVDAGNSNFNVPLIGEWLGYHTAPMDGEDETGVHPHQAAALGRYRDSHSGVRDTVAALTTPAPEVSETESDLRGRIFPIIEDALIELSEHYTTALVTLLRELVTVPEVDGSSGPVSKWTKLFGDSWSDSWKQSYWRKALENRDPRTRDKRRAEYVHRAFVEATCAMAGMGLTSRVPGSPEDGILPLSWGYECLSDALERQEDMVWDFEIPASAVWIRIAGRRIVEGATRKETSWALERDGRLWPPGPMSIDRWQFWLKRLGDAKRLGGDTCRAAESALACAREMALTE